MKKGLKNAKKIKDKEERQNAINSVYFTILQMENFTLNAMTNMGNMPIDKKSANAIVLMANGHYIKAIKEYLK